MRVSRDIIFSNRDILKEYRFIIVQHLLKDTYDFINILADCEIEVHSVIYIPYSVDKCVLNDITQKMNNVFELSQDICKICLDDAVERTKNDNKKIIILDLGGEYSDICNNYREYIECIVEDTHFGHWKYSNKKNEIPVYTVADSKLKEIEAIFVGKSIVDCSYNLLKQQGRSLLGKKVLLIGYGMIGQNVADYLKSIGCNVFVNDIDNYRLLKANVNGYNTILNFEKDDISDIDVIIGTTGKTSISEMIIDRCKTRVLLISGSSRKIEIDFSILKFSQKYCELIDLYSYGDKDILVANSGEPINFLDKSVPDEVIDLLFSEMMIVIINKNKSKNEAGSDGLYRASYDCIDFISRKWLEGKEML